MGVLYAVISLDCTVHSTSKLFAETQTDVTDVAWSPGDRYLASVGLDSAVMVWCGFTLGMLFDLMIRATGLNAGKSAFESSINIKAL